MYLVAAADTRVKAVVAQCPVFGAASPDSDPATEIYDRIRATFDSGEVSTNPDVTGPLPAGSEQRAPILNN